MKTYTVRNIANMLNVNEETVRRWIRTGRLPAVKTSNRKGNVIREIDLQYFLHVNPGYEVSDGLRGTVADTYIDGLKQSLKALNIARDDLNRQIKHIEELISKLEES